MWNQLDHYLPLPPLLDPSLHEIIPPLLSVLGLHLEILYNEREERDETYTNVQRLARIGRVVGWVAKVRGRKGIREFTLLPILRLCTSVN